MLKAILINLYERDLGKLRAEIEQYADEADLWRITGEIPNSAGNLTLHLIGNLKHFIGAVLGGSGYVRERPLEFSDSGVPRDELYTAIDEAAVVIRSTLDKLTEDGLARDFPEEDTEPRSTGQVLVHLAAHLNYHLGQINYHRRLLSGKGS